MPGERAMKKTKEQISYNMRQIKNKDSKIEVTLRKELWRRGLRYRKNCNKVYGHPDIVFPGKKVAVFCDSEFWHGYDWEHRKDDFKSNRDFWIPKIERNMVRDGDVTSKLKADGWTVLRFWGKDIMKNTAACADAVERAVRGETIESEKIYKSIDLFAGIGGIRLGFEQAFGDEIDTVFASEWNEPAQKTYRLNFHDSFEIAGDITKIKAEEIPPFDICLAGFPCQAFSLAGRRMGFDDDYKGMARGTLFQDVVRICEYHRPKVIFCENVKGLTIHDGGRTFKIITGAFEQIGYKVYSKILNSKDFGVPQNRERIYIVCFRNDIDSSSFEFPKPTGERVTIGDILEDAPISSKYYLSDVYLNTLRKHRARHEAKGNGFGYEIRPLDGIAGAVVCGGMGKERNLIIDHRPHSMTPVTNIKGEINKEDVRKLTPREWARLQGFPDTYKLDQSDTQLFKQFGNSVTVSVIKAIAEQIKVVLESAENG